MSLLPYHHKRNFAKTLEPKGRKGLKNNFRFTMQKHAASHLHYDLRLELDGVLKSWAVPKGPCLDPTVKRLAIQVEDHPIEYGRFEGIIPKGQYGAGSVLLWDEGTWEPLDKNPREAYEQGHLRFVLDAQKLKGRWDLIRFKKEQNSWFLIKYDDDYAQSEAFDITKEMPNSVAGTKKGKKTAMPDWIAPQLATLVDKPPEGNSWLHEVKFDGYRLLAFKTAKNVKLLSRNKKDWTQSFQPIADSLKKLPLKKAILDGEVVVLDEKGHSNFQLLQNSIKSTTNSTFIYFIFDLLYYDEHDLRHLPLIERKALLASLLNKAPTNLRFSDHIMGSG